MVALAMAVAAAAENKTDDDRIREPQVIAL